MRSAERVHRRSITPPSGAVSIPPSAGVAVTIAPITGYGSEDGYHRPDSFPALRIGLASATHYLAIAKHPASGRFAWTASGSESASSTFRSPQRGAAHPLLAVIIGGAAIAA